MAYKRTTSTRKVGANTTSRITTTVSSKGTKRTYSTTSGSKGNQVTNTRNSDGTWTRTVTSNGWVTKTKSPKSAIFGTKPKKVRSSRSSNNGANELSIAIAQNPKAALVIMTIIAIGYLILESI